MEKTDEFSDFVNKTSIDTGINFLRKQTLLTWDAEKRFLDWYGINYAKQILDVGCGPGFVIEKILELNNDAFVTGIDLNADFIEQAKHLLSDKKDRINLFARNALNTEFSNDSFDFAYARIIFQHLSEPVQLAKELWRILKPEGKIVILDVDEDIQGFNDPKLPFEDEMEQRSKKYRESFTSNRKIGRNLPRILKQAGFKHINFDVITIHSDITGFEPWKQFLDPVYLEPVTKAAIQAGLLTKEEAEEQTKQLNTFYVSSESKTVLLAIMVSGEKK